MHSVSSISTFLGARIVQVMGWYLIWNCCLQVMTRLDFMVGWCFVFYKQLCFTGNWARVLHSMSRLTSKWFSSVLLCFQVDWSQAPKSPAEFLGKFSLPENRKKTEARLKCNVYYYRANYLLILAATITVSFVRRPSAFVALFLMLVGSLCINNTFAQSTRWARLYLMFCYTFLWVASYIFGKSQCRSIPGTLACRTKMLTSATVSTTFLTSISLQVNVEQKIMILELVK